MSNGGDTGGKSAYKKPPCSTCHSERSEESVRGLFVLNRRFTPTITEKLSN
jgi:hypothetical protein